MSDGFTTRLQKGVAKWLHDESIATYKTTGTYTASDHAIVFDEVPPTPDRCLIIGAYFTQSATWDDTDVVSLQLRFRGTKAQAKDTADQVFALLHACGKQVLNGITVTDAKRVSTSVLGQDQNKRQERACNYELIVTNPTPNRP